MKPLFILRRVYVTLCSDGMWKISSHLPDFTWMSHLAGTLSVIPVSALSFHPAVGESSWVSPNTSRQKHIHVEHTEERLYPNNSKVLDYWMFKWWKKPQWSTWCNTSVWNLPEACLINEDAPSCKYNMAHGTIKVRWLKSSSLEALSLLYINKTTGSSVS